MTSSCTLGTAAAGPTDLSHAEPRSRPAIGILTGSGPEAGIDLWTKLLHENRRRLGPAFRGDIDAPTVHVVSDPVLGLSMELERTEAEVWDALKADAQALDGHAAVYAIACNTLNLFADRLQALELRAQLLSFTEVVGEHLARIGAQRVCLLGARPVAELGEWSPYRTLRTRFDFEPLGSEATEALHQLIYDIKWRGAAHPGLRERFAALLAGIETPVVLLACTELPLVAELPGDGRLVDVTQLVAEALLDRTGRSGRVVVVNAAPRIGVLYTGGTIGMQPHAGTLAPSAALADSLQATLQALLGEALQWRIAALASPIDSADAAPATWHAMADAILALADAGCDGVLVLHGTATLAHSAAAMAFLLQGLPIPVVFTGSMLPAIDPHSDAWPNVRGAVAALREPRAMGVRLHFAGRTLSAVRSSKRRSEGFDTFTERAAGPVVDRVAAPWSLRQRWQPQRVALLTLHPGFAPELLDALPHAGIVGCVLACYGSGTAPTGDAAFVGALARAHRAGVVLLAVSQCADGRVRIDGYEASRRLADAGVIDGGGMTAEAALGKLHALLAAGLRGDGCERWLRQDLCGEM